MKPQTTGRGHCAHYRPQHHRVPRREFPWWATVLICAVSVPGVMVFMFWWAVR